MDVLQEHRLHPANLDEWFRTRLEPAAIDRARALTMVSERQPGGRAHRAGSVHMFGGVCRARRVCTVAAETLVRSAERTARCRCGAVLAGTGAPSPARAGATQPAVVPFPPHHPRRSAMISADASSLGWSGLTVRESAGGDGRDHSRLPGPQAARSPQPPCPQSGRPSTQPQNSVVNPTRPAPQARGRRVPGEHGRGRQRGRAPGGPSRERRAHRRLPDQADPTRTDQQKEGTTAHHDPNWRLPHGCRHSHRQPVHRIMPATIKTTRLCVVRLVPRRDR